MALEYSGGDVDIVESPAAYRDADSYFEGIIKDGGATEALTTVQGYPALAIDGKTDAFDSNPSWLEIDFNGVAQIGHGFADELFRVLADSPAELVPINMSPAVAAMIASVRSGAAA